MPAYNRDEDEDRLDPRVQEYLKRQMAASLAERTPEYQASLREEASDAAAGKRSNNLSALLMNSAAKFGAVGGKTADTSGYDKFAQAQNQGIDQDQAQSAQQEARAGALDPRIMQYLKMQQDAAAKKYAVDNRPEKSPYHGSGINPETKKYEAYTSDQDGNIKWSGIEKPPPMMAGQTPSVQEYTNEAGDVLAGQKVGGRVIKSSADQVLKPVGAGANKHLVESAGKANQIANYLKAQLALFDAKTDEKDKIRLGRGMLKGMNSAFGPDAIGKDEAHRLGGSLEYGLDPAAKGWTSLAPNPAAFRQQIVDQIDAQESAAKMNRESGSAAKAPSSESAPPRPSSKKITVSNGEETLEIDPADLEDAKKDGFKPVGQ
jgi:hypothetical protein